MSRFPIVSSSLTSCDGNRCSRLRKVYGSAVLCLAVLERSSRKGAPSLPLPHQAAPAAPPPSKRGPEHHPQMQASRRRRRCCAEDATPPRFPGLWTFSRMQLKHSGLEPGRLDNFIRPNALPFSACSGTRARSWRRCFAGLRQLYGTRRFGIKDSSQALLLAPFPLLNTRLQSHPSVP